MIDLLLPQIEHVEREKFLIIMREDIAVKRGEQWLQYRTKQCILTVKIMIQVSHSHASLTRHVSNARTLHTIFDKLSMGNLQYALLYICLQCLHSQRRIMNIVLIGSQKKHTISCMTSVLLII